MKYDQIKLPILCSFMFSLAACDVPVPEVKEPPGLGDEINEADDDTYQSGDQEPVEEGNRLEPNDLPGDLGTTLVGTWAGPCSQDAMSIYSFSPNQWAQGVLVYEEGQNCEDGLLAMAVIGGEFSVEELGDDGIVSWNGKVSSYRRVFYTQDLVDYFNDTELHGYDNWEVGEGKECLNKASGPNGSILESQTIYSSLGISEDGELAFGVNASNPEDRELAIDWSNQPGGPYIKK